LEFDELYTIFRKINHPTSSNIINVRKQFFKILTTSRTIFTQKLEKKILQFHLSKQKLLKQPLKRRIEKIQILLQKYRHNSTKTIITISNQNIGFVHNLPFFKTLYSLSNLVYCTGNNIGTYTFTKFYHSPIDYSYYVEKSFNCGAKSKIKIVLRLEQVGHTKTFGGRLPHNIQITVNNYKINNLPELIVPTESGATPWRLNTPIDITLLTNLNKYEPNIFHIQWSNDPNTYVAGVYMAEQLTSEDLLVELKKRDLRSSDLSKEFIKNNYDNSVSLCVVTLKDPITTQRMKLPAKGKDCKHLQCFDARYFIQMNEKKETWACPICKKRVEFENLEIDEFFLKILQSSNLSEEIENVTLFNDGTWTPSKTLLYRDNFMAKNCSSLNKKEITLIDVDEDNINDNFDNEEIEPMASLIGSNLPNNINSTNIDDCKASTSADGSKSNENQEKVKSRPVICVLTLD